MKLLGAALLTLILFGLFGTSARADDWTDCPKVEVADAAIAACTRIIGTSSTPRSDLAVAYYNRGTALRGKGDLDAAIADYDKAVEINSRYAEAYNNRGLAYRGKRQVDRAILDFGTAIDVNPRFAEAYNNRGVARLAKREFDRAIGDFAKSVEINPRYAEGYFGRGVAYANKGDYVRAIADYDRAIVIDPAYADAYNNRGDAYANRKQYDRAIVDLDKAIEINPRFAEAYYTRGAAFRDKGDFPRAMTDLRQAMELDTAGVHRAYGQGLIASIERTLAPPTQVATTAPTGIVPPNDRRVALVIGNSQYRSTDALPNPANDSVMVAAALRQAGFTKVTVVSDVDRTGFIDALRTFTKDADTADWAVLYYAGHGMEMAGTNYLIPVDAKLQSDRDVVDEAISLDRVLAAVQGAKKLRVVILDACRNNPFLSSMQRSVATRAVSRGLARVEPSQATLIAYAAKDGTVASDGAGGNSPFASSLAKRLTERGVEINKLFRLVRNDVLVATDNRQEPFVYGSLPPEDFFFVPPKP